MTTQQAIIDAIATKLLSVQTPGSAYAAVSGRIYDTEAPENIALPLIIFTIVADPVIPYFTIDSIQVEFQVDVYGPIVGTTSGPKATRTIGDTIYALLQRSTLNITGYTGCSILCQSRAPGLDMDLIVGGRTSQDAYRDTRTYRLFGTGTS